MRVFRQVSVFLKRHILPILTFIGGVLTCVVALSTLFQEDELTKFSKSLQSGLDALGDVETPEQGLKIVQGMEDLIRVGPTAGWSDTIAIYRAKFEQDLKDREEINARNRAAIAAALQETVNQRIAAEKAAAEARAKELAEQKAREAAEAEKIRAAKLKAEQQKAAELLELRRQLASERVCQNRACTSWILR